MTQANLSVTCCRQLPYLALSPFIEKIMQVYEIIADVAELCINMVDAGCTGQLRARHTAMRPLSQVPAHGERRRTCQYQFKDPNSKTKWATAGIHIL